MHAIPCCWQTSADGGGGRSAAGAAAGRPTRDRHQHVAGLGGQHRRLGRHRPVRLPVQGAALPVAALLHLVSALLQAGQGARQGEQGEGEKGEDARQHSQEEEVEKGRLTAIRCASLCRTIFIPCVTCIN